MQGAQSGRTAGDIGVSVKELAVPVVSFFLFIFFQCVAVEFCVPGKMVGDFFLLIHLHVIGSSD